MPTAGPVTMGITVVTLEMNTVNPRSGEPNNSFNLDEPPKYEDLEIVQLPPQYDEIGIGSEINISIFKQPTV